MDRHPHRASSGRRDRRGVYTLILSTGALLGIAAAAIDVSWALVARDDLQSATDAAAHGAALVLNGTDQGIYHAWKRATLLLGEHDVFGQPIDLDRSEIHFGYMGDKGFVETKDAKLVDTVRVYARVPDMGLLLAGAFLDRDTVSLERRANARAPSLSGASSLDCYLPLAVASCLFDRYPKEKMPYVDIVLNPAGVDNAGWGRINDHANASWARDMIRSCKMDGTAVIDDVVGLTNGEMTSAIAEIASALSTSTTFWDGAALGAMPSRMFRSDVPSYAYGHTLERPILVFDGGTEYCTGSGGSFNEDMPLVGFSWAVVYDVRSTGKAEEKNVRMRLNPNVQKIETLFGGGPDWGVYAKNPTRLAE